MLTHSPQCLYQLRLGQAVPGAKNSVWVSHKCLYWLRLDQDSAGNKGLSLGLTYGRLNDLSHPFCPRGCGTGPRLSAVGCRHHWERVAHYATLPVLRGILADLRASPILTSSLLLPVSGRTGEGLASYFCGLSLVYLPFLRLQCPKAFPVWF